MIFLKGALEVKMRNQQEKQTPCNWKIRQPDFIYRRWFGWT